MAHRIRRVFAIAILIGSVAVAVAADPWIESIRGPQYFAVSVEDVDRSVAWYRMVLGLELRDDTEAPDGRWRIVNLHRAELLVEVIRDNRDQAADRSRGFAKVGFGVADVEAVADRVEQASGERPRVLEFEKHGIRLLQLKDPDGNTLQLFSPLGEEE